MEEFINDEFVIVEEEVSSWQEAIKKSAKPLIDKGFINEVYVEAMINNVEEHGPYIVLAPKFAMPHAENKEGVIKTGISVLKLDQAVDFNIKNESDPDKHVNLLITLAAKDSESHLTILQKLALILDDDDNIEKILKAETSNDVAKNINEIVEKG